MLLILVSVLAAVMLIYEFAVPDDPNYPYSIETIPGILYSIIRIICAGFFSFTIW